MNTNIKIFLLCPVPEEQKPINLYIGLKENPLTNWTTLAKKNYQQRLLSFFLFFFGVISLLRFPSLLAWNYFLEWLCVNIIFSMLTLILLLGVIFFRWKQVEKDFNAPQIIYEEASWYDGQIWEKPFSIVKNDKLISTQKIKPILQRITRTIFTSSCFTLGFLLFLEII